MKEKILKLRREEGAGITAAMAGAAVGNWAGEPGREVLSPQDRFPRLCLYPYFTRARNISTWRNVKLPTRHLYTEQEVSSGDTQHRLLFCRDVIIINRPAWLTQAPPGQNEFCTRHKNKWFLSSLGKENQKKSEISNAYTYVCMLCMQICSHLI